VLTLSFIRETHPNPAERDMVFTARIVPATFAKTLEEAGARLEREAG
jgi:hypothetical protein